MNQQSTNEGMKENELSLTTLTTLPSMYLTYSLAGWLIRRQHSTRPLSQKLNRSNGEEIKSGDQFMCKTTKNVDVQIQDTDDAIQRHSMKIQKLGKKDKAKKIVKFIHNHWQPNDSNKSIIRRERKARGKRMRKKGKKSPLNTYIFFGVSAHWTQSIANHISIIKIKIFYQFYVN